MVNMSAAGPRLSVPRPPASSLHPLSLLDEFLESLDEANPANDQQDNEHDDATSERAASAAAGEQRPTAKQSLEKRRDRILSVADFLYGGSMLEAALAVLDTDEGGGGAICQITSHPSNRTAFLVKGASHYRQPTTSSSFPTNYFCLLPSSSGTDNSNNDGGIQYCSCRSYFERAKNDPNALCKHLLALKLMPALQIPCRTEGVSDAEFSSYLLRRILPRQGQS